MVQIQEMQLFNAIQQRIVTGLILHVANAENGGELMALFSEELGVIPAPEKCTAIYLDKPLDWNKLLDLPEISPDQSA